MDNIKNIKDEILEIFTEKQNYDEKYNSFLLKLMNLLSYRKTYIK